MKNCLVILSLCLFLGFKEKDILVTLEEATAQQLITYDFQDRDYELTDLTHSDWPYVELLIPDTSFTGIPPDKLVFRRNLQVLVPREQSENYHIESMNIELAILVDQELIDETNNRFISNDLFQSLFLAAGDVNTGNRKAKVSYHQTYWIAHYQEEEYPTFFTINEVLPISDVENAFLVSGTFATDWESFSDLTNGQFQFIIKN